MQKLKAFAEWFAESAMPDDVSVGGSRDANRAALLVGGAHAGAGGNKPTGSSRQGKPRQKRSILARPELNQKSSAGEPPRRPVAHHESKSSSERTSSLQSVPEDPEEESEEVVGVISV
mmetsp:Transcript_22260/g.61698  ORF Transcript_22260/g.61698 Transcript_22260/m.61698 type:complete len:118 (-) Transcript_22260:110-463(-)